MEKLQLRFIKGRWRAYITGTKISYTFSGEDVVTQVRNVRMLGQAMKNGLPQVDAIIPEILENVARERAALVTEQMFALTDQIIVGDVVFEAAAERALVYELEEAGKFLLEVAL